MADFSRELWFASERSDEKQNIRMHQIRMRTFGCDLRTFGYEQRTMVSHPNSEIRIKWRWALRQEISMLIDATIAGSRKSRSQSTTKLSRVIQGDKGILLTETNYACPDSQKWKPAFILRSLPEMRRSTFHRGEEGVLTT